MNTAQYEPFKGEHLHAAAQLLARQGQSLLKKFPLLPEQISDPDVTFAFLQALLEKAESHGMVQINGSRLQAFMLGYYGTNPFFGRHCWVPFGGFAFAHPDAGQALRWLYAAAGDQWMQDQVFNHYIVCPAIPAWLQAGYSLTFGQEQVYAVTSLATKRMPVPLPDGLEMRQVVPADAQPLFERGHWIAAHLNQAPVWEPVPDEHMQAILPEYAKLASEPEGITWVVEDHGQIVAYVVLYTVDCGPEHLLGVSTAAEFAAAAVHRDYRRRGVGRALFTQIINIAREQQYTTMFTDWRTTNLQAASYWPSYDFKPFAYRLLRRVNPRYQLYQHPSRKETDSKTE